MQIIIRDRVTQTPDIDSVRTQPIEASGYPAFTISLVGHLLNGTSPSIAVQFETSDNLEDWANVGSSVALASAGMATGNVRVGNGDNILRYIRASIQTAGTLPVVNYMLTINLFQGT